MRKETLFRSFFLKLALLHVLFQELVTKVFKQMWFTPLKNDENSRIALSNDTVFNNVEYDVVSALSIHVARGSHTDKCHYYFHKWVNLGKNRKSMLSFNCRG